MIYITKYRLIPDIENQYRVRSEEESICPVCGCIDLKVIGSRKRGALKGDGDGLVLIIRRLRCKACRKIHHELPDILIPYKRYTSEVIEDILDDTAPLAGCETSSILRIKAWFSAMSEYIAGSLSGIAIKLGFGIGPGIGTARQRIKNMVGAFPGWLARAVRTLVNTNNWVHTRSAFLS